ncbi:MAG: 6-phosphofructokinase [bacterium]|nr:6-phosphofructokinase [bacterium]
MNKKSNINRIGVLTGGGDCPGLNAVIRAVFRTAHNHYGFQVIGISDGYRGLIEKKWKTLENRDVTNILSLGGTILGTTNRDNPFKYRVENKGKVKYKDLSGRLIKNVKDMGLKALIVIGGDGTLRVASELIKKGLPIVGIPKTIDNDLSCTDVTFGFDTALNIATEALDRLKTTAESHHRVMVLEVMGRDSGWIALESGIAGGADVILIPEIPYKIEKVCDFIRERKKRGKRFSIVVVAEGSIPVGGTVTIQRTVADPSMPYRLGGVGNKVGSQIEELTGIETRVTVLGHVQRGGTPTAFDRILSTRFGSTSVDLAMEGKFGHMLCLTGEHIKYVPLTEAVGKLRVVPADGDFVKTVRRMGVCVGD